MTTPFNVTAFTDYDPDHGDRLVFKVDLGHQCGNWVITEKEDPDDAIEEMESFIARAEEALIELKFRILAKGKT